MKKLVDSGRLYVRPAVGVLASMGVLGFSMGMLGLLSGCANPEASQARVVAAQRMGCSPDALAAGVERETPLVREWVVGCNFVYTRVHCTDAGCYQAPPKPPCLGDVPCFVEDEMTLRWILPDGEVAAR